MSFVGCLNVKTSDTRVLQKRNISDVIDLTNSIRVIVYAMNFNAF